MKSLTEYIKIYNNQFPDELCDEILTKTKNSDLWTDAPLLNEVDKKVRSCDQLFLCNYPEIDKSIFLEILKVLKLYADEFEQIVVSQDTGYTLLRYDTGQFYKQHTDTSTGYPRTLACSIALNSDFEGGEFAFFDKEITYPLKKGDVIVFPSNFMYPHQILPVTEGTRYSVITWFN